MGWAPADSRASLFLLLTTSSCSVPSQFLLLIFGFYHSSSCLFHPSNLLLLSPTSCRSISPPDIWLSKYLNICSFLKQCFVPPPAVLFLLISFRNNHSYSILKLLLSPLLIPTSSSSSSSTSYAPSSSFFFDHANIRCRVGRVTEARWKGSDGRPSKSCHHRQLMMMMLMMMMMMMMIMAVTRLIMVFRQLQLYHPTTQKEPEGQLSMVPSLALSGVSWLALWLFLALSSSLWSSLELSPSGAIWLFLDPSSSFWLFLALSGSFWHSLALSLALLITTYNDNDDAYGGYQQCEVIEAICDALPF